MNLYFFKPAAVIRVTGEDAFTFLQGQFTNELRQSQGSSIYGLWLSQKGKVLADSHVLKVTENEFILVSMGSPAAVILQRLEPYIIADDVVLVDESGNMTGLAVWGGKCGEILKAQAGSLPESGRFLQQDRWLIFPGRRSAGENYEIIGPESGIDEWRRKLTVAGASEATIDDAEEMRIASGIPAVPADIGPTDLPNEAGLESTAISFTKGCYLGQEVMARLKNLGQVRRQLQGVRGDGAAPERGTLLYQGEKKAGEIRSAVSTAEGFIALAMLSRTGLDDNLGFCFSPSDPASQKPVVWMNSQH